MNTIRLCPGCGAALPPDAPAGLCPQCLLKSEDPTLSAGTAAVRPGVCPSPRPGEMFGAYRIVRLLGQGGMGEVFEAEHSETGRRVALKVMSHALASEQDRKRFLREGRLAASVNHPNVVYIHGSEEIDGAPVITMELVQGGTLKDRLKRDGPLSVADAVEIALQVIAGLEAAHSAGVLHRDIKPANCFVTPDGAVKVGDFGLSVSTLARGESLLTAAGAVLGTPAYASPEQLRGENADVRSDIYSVGATLYHLLTGATPFSATDFVKLITEVLDKEPAAPSTLRPDLPVEMSKLLLRCLAKDRKARFQTYAELRDALLPFRAVAFVPANPARRCLAGLVDYFFQAGPMLAFAAYWNVGPLDNLVRERTLTAALTAALFFLWALLYYTLTEGLWGAAVGKSLCGLCVVGPERQPPGLPQALLRTVMFMIPGTLPSFVLMAVTPLAQIRASLAQGDVPTAHWLPITLFYVLFALLFGTMRRRNGYAALHDLFTRTRVIIKPRTQPRPKLAGFAPVSANLPSASTSPAAATALAKLGPYEIRAPLWQCGDEELLLAFDPALRRQVWIHRRSASAAPVSTVRRDLSRPARLRWLMGGRTATQLWDAYDAVEGQALWHESANPRPWNAVRFWLLDLAEELGAALNNPGSAPVLALDRVWLAADGGALLLDFPCPGLRADSPTPPPLPLEGMGDVQRFLDEVARVALTEPHLPLPLSAETFLRSLAKGTFEKVEFIVGNLQSLIARPAEITRGRRAASLAFAPAVMLMLSVLGVATISFQRIRCDRAWARAYPDKPSLRAAAQLYTDAVRDLRRRKTDTRERNVKLIRTYLAHHFSSLITNDAVWTRAEFREAVARQNRPILQEAVTGHPASTLADLEEAERTVSARIRAQEQFTLVKLVSFFTGGIWGGSMIFALVEVTGAVAFRQSLLLGLFGFALVDRHGQPATRRRLLRRSLVFWIGVPVLLLVVEVSGEAITKAGFPRTWVWVVETGVLGLLLAAMIYAVTHPSQTLVDRDADTWLVPK